MSGTSSTSQVEKLMGRENWNSWNFSMKHALIADDLWDAVEGKEKDESKIRKALARIVLAVDKINHSHIRTATNAKDAWNSLKAAFEDTGLTRKITLLKSLTGAKLVDFPTMGAYCDHVLTAAQNLKEIEFNVPDEWVGAILLAGLPDSFKPMIMGLESSGTKITGDSIKVKLLQEGMPADPSESAFLSKRNKPPKCSKCSRIGHFARDCYAKKKEKDTSKEHKGSNKPKEKEKDGKKAWIACYSLNPTTSSSDGQFYLDSCASAHIANSSCRNFTQKQADNTKITAVDNQVLTAQSIGTTCVSVFNGKETTEIDVNNILYIPQAATNILSVSKITEAGFTVVFNKHGGEIYDESGEIFALAAVEGGLYRLITGKRGSETCFFTGEPSDLWHRRLAHLNSKGLEILAENSTGMKGNFKFTNPCEPCSMGKQSRLPAPSRGRRTDKLLTLIHSDVCGPFATKSIGGSRYFLTLVEDHSRYVTVYILKSKDQVASCIEEYVARVECQIGTKIKKFRTDRGTEYLNNRIETFFKKKGVQHQKTVRYSSFQNGVAERFNRTLQEKARCMMADAQLGPEYWAEAVLTAAYLINRSPARILGGVTPYQLWEGEKPDLDHLRIFGSPAMVHVPDQLRRKWDQKSVKLIFIGYCPDTKGYRLIDPVSKKVTISRDVIFLETAHSMNHSQDGLPQKMTQPETIDLQSFESPQDNDTEAEQTPEDSDEGSENGTSQEEGTDNDEYEESLTFEPSINDPDFTPDTPITTPEDIRRSSRQPKPKVFPDHVTFLAGSCNPDEPTTYKQAIESDHAASWKNAMDDEFASLKKTQTFSVVDLPVGKRALTSRWVYRVKGDGDNKKFKARLVVRGCSQIMGLDYHETYSPVVKYPSLRYLLSIAVEKNLIVTHADVKTAYLYGDLEEETYVVPPPELLKPSEKGKVWRLHKSMYGLRQSGRCWYAKIDATLKKLSLKPCAADPCIYYRIDKKDIVILALFVDDLVLMTSDESLKKKILNKMEEEFEMKDLGPISHCLGMDITRDEKAGKLWMSQADYIGKVLQRFNMQDCKPSSTPMETNIDCLALKEGESPKPFCESVPYQEAVGCLIYLSQISRPDITYAVGIVSRFCKNFQKVHWTAVKRIMRYLKETQNMKLEFSRGNQEIVAFSDADWGNLVNSRYSISGGCLKVGKCLISWFSKKQKTVAKSTFEAETVALSDNVTEVIWFRQLVSEIQPLLVSGATKIFCDNSGAVKNTRNNAINARTKHIDVKHHFIKDHVKNKNIDVAFLSTEQMLADGLTKPLGKNKLNVTLKGFGLCK